MCGSGVGVGWGLGGRKRMGKCVGGRDEKGERWGGGGGGGDIEERERRREKDIGGGGGGGYRREKDRQTDRQTDGRTDRERSFSKFHFPNKPYL